MRKGVWGKPLRGCPQRFCEAKPGQKEENTWARRDLEAGLTRFDFRQLFTEQNVEPIEKRGRKSKF